MSDNKNNIYLIGKITEWNYFLTVLPENLVLIIIAATPTQSLCSKIVFAKQSIVSMETFVQCLHSFNFLLVICYMDKFLKASVDPFSSASL